MVKKPEPSVPTLKSALSLVRRPYDPARPRVGREFGPSMAVQASKDQCDINQIMKRFQQTGLVDHVSAAVAQYGDFSEAADYKTSLLAVQAADEAFARIPAAIRKRFENDPGQFVAFVLDPKNADECESLGLLSPDAVSRREKERAAKAAAPPVTGSPDPAKP